MQGTLAQLDSKNPVMYLEFPEGRLKLFGKLNALPTPAPPASDNRARK
jgi:hypothetical protein